MFHVIDNENADLNIKKLLRLCATRWIQRYDAVNDFCELLPYVMISLDKISEWRDSSGADASILKKAIDSEFLILLFVIKVIYFNLFLFLYFSKITFFWIFYRNYFHLDFHYADNYS